MNTTSAVLLLVGLFAVIFTLSVPIGIYMSAVFDGTLSQKFPWMYRVESIFLWPLGKSGREPMDWKEYCVSLIALTVVGTVIGYLIFRFQGYLPYNPLNFKGLAPDLAFNTAVSFSTSTTWQGYDCENVMSLFSQAFGLCTLTFLSSSTGVVAAFAFARGLIQSRDPSLGNAWEDMVRCVLWPAARRNLLNHCRVAGLHADV
jgi:K+-transporting ATPase ATPase A chain